MGVITGVHPRSKFGMVEINKNNLVTSFLENPILSDWINAGFMVFDKKAFDYFKPGEMEHPALERMAQRKQLSLFKHTGFWASMDTYKEVNDLNDYWKQDKPPWKVWK
jgi:glucose-1-phosphate cytidylyltransferase